MIHSAAPTPAHSRESGNPVSATASGSGSPLSRGRAELERLTPLFRFSANMLALWGLCANVKCRRARACRGDCRDCVPRYAPLVPEDAREGVKAMVEGRMHDMSFDAVQDEAFDEVGALLEWRGLIERAARRG